MLWVFNWYVCLMSRKKDETHVTDSDWPAPPMAVLHNQPLSNDVVTYSLWKKIIVIKQNSDKLKCHNSEFTLHLTIYNWRIQVWICSDCMPYIRETSDERKNCRYLYNKMVLPFFYSIPKAASSAMIMKLFLEYAIQQSEKFGREPFSYFERYRVWNGTSCIVDY